MSFSRFGKRHAHDGEIERDERIRKIRQADKEDTYVYVFHTLDNFYKIGLSKDVDQRLSAIQREKPVNIQHLISAKFDNRRQAQKLERHLHKHFKEFCFQGEWFILRDDQLLELKAVCQNEGAIIVYDETANVETMSKIDMLIYMLENGFNRKYILDGLIELKNSMNDDTSNQDGTR